MRTAVEPSCSARPSHNERTASDEYSKAGSSTKPVEKKAGPGNDAARERAGSATPHASSVASMQITIRSGVSACLLSWASFIDEVPRIAVQCPCAAVGDDGGTRMPECCLTPSTYHPAPSTRSGSAL